MLDRQQPRLILSEDSLKDMQHKLAKTEGVDLSQRQVLGDRLQLLSQSKGLSYKQHMPLFDKLMQILPADVALLSLDIDDKNKVV
eukprot:SAG25_NODE_11924_length_292_cov_0.725389_1_plen_84_part_01